MTGASLTSAMLPIRTQAADTPNTVLSDSRVTTYAGNGRAANVDGMLSEAEFSSPSSLAVGANGAIYVVDKALNTVRVIRNGRVKTIAGYSRGAKLWSDGGYTDGPLLVARFNHPEGIAVAPNGAIYIADTLNLCIRKIQGNSVSTVAGAPGRWGSQDGPATAAQFEFPVGITTDDAGNVFVADEGNGIREIVPDGAVSTLPVKTDGNVSSLSVGKGPTGTFLYVADDEGIAKYSFADRSTERTAATVELTRLSKTQGSASLGFPYAIAALSDHEVVFTDARTDTIRYMHDNYVRVIAGKPSHDPANYAGGFADGPSMSAQFNAPIGIAALKDGSFLISDAGNHRIRSVSPFDSRYYVAPAADNLAQYTPQKDSDVGIGYVGNSLSWTDSTWNESIGGQLQQMLNRSKKSHYAVVPVTSPGASLAAISSLSVDLLSDTGIRYLVLQFNSAFISNYGKVPYAELIKDRSWQDATEKQLVALKNALAQRNVHLVVLLQPYGYEISPSESAQWQRILHFKLTQMYPEIAALHQLMRETLAASHVSYADAWGVFENEEINAHGPLFGNFDPHMSYRGRYVMAKFAYDTLRDYLHLR